MLNIHSGTKIFEGAKQEMARAIYDELLGLQDKDVRNLSQAEQKRICWLAFTYQGIAVANKRELPPEIKNQVEKTTRSVTQGNQTERDQMEYEDRAEAEAYLTPEERKML